jgi:hypothetical protein
MKPEQDWQPVSETKLKSEAKVHISLVSDLLNRHPKKEEEAC